MFDILIGARLVSSLGLSLLAGIAVAGALPGPDRTHRGAALALALAVVAALAAQIAAMAFAAAPDDGVLAWQPIRLLALTTWSGKVVLLRLGLAALLLIVIAAARRSGRTAWAMLIAANLFLLPFSGHAVSADPWQASTVIHGLHTLTVLTWAGTVVVLAAGAARSREPSAQWSRIAAFSPWALGLVTIGIVTGSVAAWFQLGSAAALFGTPYGQLLLFKSAALLGIALACAAWLRWRYLRSVAGKSPRLALLVEAAMALGMLAVASFMSQSIPGRHADIVWPLPFRLDWRLIEPGQPASAVLRGHLAFAAAMIVVTVGGAVFRRWTLALVAGFAALLIGGLGAAGLAVQAYPTTYAAPIGAYAADRLSSARRIFKTKCTGCHGDTGRGDGIYMRAAGAWAADLTAPHTGDHTAGDMYWWITHGKPGSLMAGVGEETTDLDRWDLVNYVRLLTNSARSAVVGLDIAPLQPFLPSIDVTFMPPGGGSLSLRDIEGEQPALVVLARENGSADRLAEFEKHRDQIEAQNLLVIFVCGPETRDLIAAGNRGPNIIVMTSATDDIVGTWSFYRRTPASRDEDDHATNVGHLEFLIDRFGYVRAKWRTDEGLFPSIDTILDDVRQLAAEPRLLAPPEDHGH